MKFELKFVELDEIQKKDDKISRGLEMVEIDFWNLFLREYKINSNLNKLVNIYSRLHRLEDSIDDFKDLVNTNLKK